MQLKKLTFWFVVCLLFIAPAALAQKASLTGLLTDQTGAVLPGVTVTATNQLTNIKSTALSNETGHYTIVNLNPAVYRLEAELPGFKKYVQSEITLDVEQAGRVDIKLEVGQITDTVHVIGEAPVLNTENAAKGSVIYNAEITDLPVESRDFLALAFLTVGVIPADVGGQGGFASVNGARIDSMNFVLDGGNNNSVRAGAAAVAPSTDSIQEFKVQTSNYSAEYGRRSTGVINVVLRSGTNVFHGSLFEFHRNSVFDARSFFDPENPPLLRNNFGANLGGPVIKDKAFFFINYEGWYFGQGATQLGRTLTLGERTGDFSSLLPGTTIKDPLTQKAFPGNILPANRFHPTSVKLLEYYPLPNIARGGFNYSATEKNVDDFHDFAGKFDYSFWTADSLSVRYLGNKHQLVIPYLGNIIFPGFSGAGSQTRTAAGITWTHTITPRVITQLLFNFTRQNEKTVGNMLGHDYCADFGIVGCTKDPERIGFPLIAIQGVGNIGDAQDMPIVWHENDFDINNTWSIVTGNHNMRFGGEQIRTQYSESLNEYARGFFNFNQLWTGNPVADFLMGFLANTSRRLSPSDNYTFSRDWAAFFQDDWKIRKNLTLNLGVRWDYFSPPYEKSGKWSSFYPELGRVVVAGEEGFPRSLIHSPKTNFGPRLGIAWRVRNKMVVRTGFGQFYGISIQAPTQHFLAGNPPFAIRENYSRLASNPLLLAWNSPFPADRSVIAGVTSPTGYESHAPAANAFQYNLTFEQELMQSVVWEFGYVGSKGTHLGRMYNINQQSWTLQPNGTAVGTRPFPQFSNINYFAFECNSNYHAFQTSLRKRGRGLDFRINYTLSKSIDDGSGLVGGASRQGVNGVQNANNRSAERGLSDFDRRHALSASFIYKVPFKGNFLIRDWQLNSILGYYSGTPISPAVANVDVAAGYATRPDRIGSGELDNPGPGMWFNLADFPMVPKGSYRFGNTGRNVLTGPNSKKVDFSVMRSFPMPWKEHRLQFRWEIFNVPNFANFSFVVNQVNIPTSGQINRAAPGRQMQFALKYMF